jgi:hypothetical protein
VAMSLPTMSEDEVERTVRHVSRAIEAAPERTDPFHHLQFADFFPSDIYAAMRAAMPAQARYRRMSGRARSNRNEDGAPTRTKIDLFPEYIRHMAGNERPIWGLVGRTLRSAEVREAFRARLARGLGQRFGASAGSLGMYAVPILTRDVPGYRIGIHPDTRHKAMTVQIYLPADRSIEHVGTVFHRRKEDKAYERASQMAFAPNTGYAFAVGSDTYHSVDPVGPEVRTRDSILLTYFVDDSWVQVLHNRSKRFGNLVLNEVRSLAR